MENQKITRYHLDAMFSLYSSEYGWRPMLVSQSIKDTITELSYTTFIDFQEKVDELLPSGTFLMKNGVRSDVISVFTLQIHDEEPVRLVHAGTKMEMPKITHKMGLTADDVEYILKCYMLGVSVVGTTEKRSSEALTRCVNLYPALKRLLNTI